MKYQEQSGTFGAWVKADQLESGVKAKIVSEVKPQPSQFFDDKGNAKNQDVGRVRFQGAEEAVNVALNRATLNGLIKAFGEDSAVWQNKVLTAETEKMRVGGKAVTALYLIPEGFKRIDDANGYAVIVKEGEEQITYPEGEANPDDIPF